MSNKRTPIKLLTNVVVVVLASHSTAHAYLDLGTGSFILQAVLAGVAATWLTCSTYWQRIKSMFQKKSVDETIDHTDQTDSHADKGTEPRNL